jgi:acyl-CoA synthetase (AMP-forming)/AMP-acid ligase II
VVVIPYSSGTSGLPKGVLLTHFNLVTQLQQLTAVHVKLTKDDTLVGVLPFFHIYGMTVILNASLAFGAKTVTLPKFDPPLFLKVLKEHGVTVAHVAPPLVGFLAKHPAVDSVLPLPKLRELFSGAAPLGADLAAAAMARLGVRLVRQGYGMTEMSPASHVHPYDAPFAKVGGIGTLIPGMRCKMVSPETGLPVGVGERGELWLKGPNVMPGYLNNAAATAETIDADGYLHTGDVGVVDEDGYYFIVDRVKELIKVKGFQVAPAELEALLLTCPAVGDAAVVGVPHPKFGEAPKAYVVKQGGHEGLSEADIQAFVKGKVADYKELAGGVEFVAAVPKSAAGKILRKDLRKMEEDRRKAAAS